MSNWRNVTLGDIGAGLSRYWPFMAVVAAVVLVVGFLPGSPVRNDGAGTIDVASGEDTVSASGDDAAGGTEGGAGGDGTTATGDGSGGVSGGAGGSTEGGVSGSGTIGGGAIDVPAGTVRNCDNATGRIRVPSKFTPPCVPVAESNGGSTYSGVSADKITVVVYDAKSNPAVEAALTAAGANNSFEQRQDTFRAYVDMINKNYELQGRQIDLKFFRGTADVDEDDKGRADAIAVAGMKPFIVIGHINNAFVDELVARKIVCICTTSVPNDFYMKRSPYVGYTYLMSSTQGYIHRAEYICKRVAGKKAKWAGFRDNPTDQMSQEDRKFGLLYYETADNAYRTGIDGFEKSLQACGVDLPRSRQLAYNGYPDIEKTQEQARPLITKLKSEGVNSVIFSGDPFAPAFFTSEAARQNWQPEWIITGSALTDTNLFARTYNQDQWSRAFGISFLTISIPEEQREAHALHTWHTGRPPAADGQYGVIWSPVMAMGIGLHMAGPNLTPQQFQAGMFRYPVTGHGFVSSATISWGKQKFWGGLIDFTAADDVAEIWWDRNAVGEDEVGNTAPGMYRWVQGGKRYLPGEHPRTEPGAFNPNGAPTELASRPPNETPPQYPPKR